VLDAALRQQRAWREEGLMLGIAVNLSMRNLHDPDLPGTVARLLDRHGMPPAALCLELTESAVMADLAHARDVLSTGACVTRQGVSYRCR